jgi:hypothetical protein
MGFLQDGLRYKGSILAILFDIKIFNKRKVKLLPTCSTKSEQDGQINEDPIQHLEVLCFP